MHIEISSRNPAQAKEFYEGLFGWKFDFNPSMNYYTFNPGSGPGGGLWQNDQMPPGIQVYVGVADVQSSLKKAEALGAQVLQWKAEIPGFGWFGIIRDKEGITLGLYEATPRPPAPQKAAAKKAKGKSKAKSTSKKSARRKR